MIKELLSAPFIILLFVAFVLWFLTQLSREYTTIIELEVAIESDFESDMIISDPLVSVNVLAKGDGRDLLQYKLGIAEDIVVPLSKLSLRTIQGAEPFYYQIDEKSMELAIAAEQPNFLVQMVIDTIEQVRVSEVVSRRLPIIPLFDINCEDGFMLQGAVSLSMDSIDVKMPAVLAGSIDVIYTDRAEFNNVRTPLIGVVGLDIPSGVVASHDMVRFSVDVVGFTEEVFELEVELDGSKAAIISPRDVRATLRVPLNRSYNSTMVSLEAYVDSVAIDLKGVVRSVRLRGVPSDVITYSVEPEFVEIYTTH